MMVDDGKRQMVATMNDGNGKQWWRVTGKESNDRMTMGITYQSYDGDGSEGE